MLKKIMKILLGVALLPFCAGFTWQFGASVFSMAYKPDLPYYFLAGGLTYLSVHLLEGREGMGESRPVLFSGPVLGKGGEFSIFNLPFARRPALSSPLPSSGRAARVPGP